MRKSDIKLVWGRGTKQGRGALSGAERPLTRDEGSGADDLDLPCRAVKPVLHTPSKAVELQGIPPVGPQVGRRVDQALHRTGQVVQPPLNFWAELDRDVGSKGDCPVH